MFTNPDEAEKRRLYAAFHAADSNNKGHLNLQEFTSAMNSLQLKAELNDKILRNYFHAADLNGDGVLDVDEFLISIQEIKHEEGNDELTQLVINNFDLRPAAIINQFKLREMPKSRNGRFYRDVAAYGHFGRPDLNLPWEDVEQKSIELGKIIN